MVSKEALTAPDNSAEKHIFVVVMGVSGTGKSTLGSALAKALDMPYVEGDDLHPKSNVDKMSTGIPLTDADREPWLKLIRTTVEHMCVEQSANPEKKGNLGVVATCSALKRYYRDILRGRTKPVTAKDEKEANGVLEHLEPAHPEVLPTYFVFIDGPRDVLLDRMQKRPGHFMKATMLDSQLQTLESPVGEGGVVAVPLLDSTEDQVTAAKRGLSKLSAITLEVSTNGTLEQTPEEETKKHTEDVN
ncbi:P-loop containing nucleoside triphosphate hydrolase protein [Cyathus striatus]|nr:P-loop containing nucleoside triphosphate hydrolase protein [Cyathus striatus]